MPSAKPRNTCGFTLLELLVAIAVFAVMSVMAYGGLKNVIDNSETSRESMQRLEQVQKTVTALTRDLVQLHPRGIIDSYGNPRPFLVADERDEDLLVEFTRSGRRNPAGLARSSLQRVGYRVEDNKLYRVIWRSLDRAPGEEPLQSELIDQVESMEFRFLNEAGEAGTSWPPLSAGAGGSPASTLRGVEFELTLADWGSISRSYRVVVR